MIILWWTFAFLQIRKLDHLLIKEVDFLEFSEVQNFHRVSTLYAACSGLDVKVNKYYVMSHRTLQSFEGLGGLNS